MSLFVNLLQAFGVFPYINNAFVHLPAGLVVCRLQKLEPLKLSIVDESGGEESKFMITIVSKSFEGLTLLKRHRSVYGLMADEMKVVHAVTLDTKTPEEVGL